MTLKKMTICLFIVALVQISPGFCDDYDFVVLTKSFEKIAGKPFPIVNMKGMKTVTFLYSGQFKTISDKAEMIMKKLKVPKISDEARKVAEMGFEAMKKSGMNIKGCLTYNVTPDILVCIMLIEKEKMSILTIQEINQAVLKETHKGTKK